MKRRATTGRTKILMAAAKLIVEKGIYPGIIGDIAKAAGVTPALIYANHSKPAIKSLFEEIVKDFFEELETKIVTALDIVRFEEEGAVTKLRKILMITIQIFRSRDILAQAAVQVQEFRVEKEGEGKDAFDRICRLIDKLIVEAKERGEFNEVTKLLENWNIRQAVFGTTLQSLRLRPQDQNQFVFALQLLKVFCTDEVAKQLDVVIVAAKEENMDSRQLRRVGAKVPKLRSI